MALTVHTVSEINEIVSVVKEAGAFSFDIESRGVLERHPDVLEHFEKECSEHIKTLKNPSADIVARSTEAIRQRYLSQLALDPKRNEVFWIGIATTEHSWAIPMGHKVGNLITPEEKGDGSTVPPPGYRKVLKDGSESLAKAKYVIPATFEPAPRQLDRFEVFEALRPLFFSDCVKVNHNVKFDARSIQKYYSELPSKPYCDTMVLQHICDENISSFSLVSLIQHNFSNHNAYREGKIGKNIDNVPFDVAARYVHLDARWAWLTYKKLIAKLKIDCSLIPVLEKDMELLYVIMHMEEEGISVDYSSLKSLRKELDSKLKDTLLSISEIAYPGFNPDSNKEKQQFLFNKKREGGLGLKPPKRTPNNAPSVDSESLEKLRGKHPIIPLLLDWQELQKLKSTYVEGLIPKLNRGKLHPSFHLHRTATGRLSSSDPNLQNIPRESTVRKLFVPPEGYKMLVADYDQIELRVMAMFSQDKELLRIFSEGIDIHTATAAAVFKKPLEEVTSEERQIGKGVNFLTAYGGGYAKLARTTGIDDTHAQNILTAYKQSFKGLTQWKNKTIALAQKKGYVTTLSGRRRRLIDITSSNAELASRAERQAINAVIQGSAADICKDAMIQVFSAFKDTNAKLVVQVHDELVAVSPEDEDVQELFVNAMGHNRSIMGVSLKVSCHSARSWSEAKGK